MRPCIRLWIVVPLFMVASCGTTNHLDKYDLKVAPIYVTASIDPPVEHTNSSSNSDDGSSILASLTIAVLDALLTTQPDPFITDPSLAVYCSSGFSAELENTLSITTAERKDDARFTAYIHITSCSLHSTGDACVVWVNEALRIKHTSTDRVVLDENRTLEVPLRYCGSVEDTVSTSGETMSKDRYRHLMPGEQLSALQCSLYDAGADLADSLSAMVRRAIAVPSPK